MDLASGREQRETRGGPRLRVEVVMGEQRLEVARPVGVEPGERGGGPRMHFMTPRREDAGEGHVLQRTVGPIRASR
ncbi:MAG TPA: hypothetical protein VLK35_14725 [Methylomirabilota bacterium]|nr:hypothetical protein [Methylomirabilota bacterium]